MTKIEIRNELRNLRKLCRAGKGKESNLYKKYQKLFAEALDDWERMIMERHFIEDKSYHIISIQFKSGKRSIERAISDSIDKIKSILHFKGLD